METIRVPAEDRAQVATVIGGREYRARDGWFEMPPDTAKVHLAAAGYGKSWQVAGVASRRSGFRCVGCGFEAFFRVCGRCGAECVKEQ